jgi:uncharacterized membrane protein
MDIWHAYEQRCDEMAEAGRKEHEIVASLAQPHKGTGRANRSSAAAKRAVFGVFL